jgi:uroporphyrin-III C-methyltransferase/precorrin-2 dehydrogenase/sirohydrochlorin ferrochelatase
MSERDGAEAGLLPVFLRLEGRRVVLVGGGTVACAKLPELVRAGALITIVAPEVRPEIAAREGLVIARRGFVASDLDAAWFAVAAAPPEINRQVAVAAGARRVFVNVVDDARRASAYMGGVLRRGGVSIAISTEGRAPALAGILREGIEALLPEDLEAWVIEASRLRQEQRAAGVRPADRRPRLLAALNRLYEGRGAAAPEAG